MRASDIRLRNNVSVFGHGETPMFFAHGLGCDKTMWRKITPFFEEDYQVITFDMIGSGRSDAKGYSPQLYTSLSNYADNILEIIDALELRDIIFVGHSVSAMLGILAHLKRPDLFRALVLIGPSPCYINKEGYYGGFDAQDIDDLLEMMASNYFGWSSDMSPVIMGNEEHPEYAAQLESCFHGTNPDIAKQFARLTFLSDNREDLPKIKVPSLILQCAQDVIAPEQVGKYMHEQIPSSEIIYLEATGHCPHVSAPTETAEQIKFFLEKYVTS